MGQGLMDTYDEEGICYAVGNAIPDIVVEIVALKGSGTLMQGFVRTADTLGDTAGAARAARIIEAMTLAPEAAGGVADMAWLMNAAEDVTSAASLMNMTGDIASGARLMNATRDIASGARAADKTTDTIWTLEKVEDVFDSLDNLGRFYDDIMDFQRRINDLYEDFLEQMRNGAEGFRDLMTPGEAARYDKYWNNVADDMLKNKVNSYRQAILNREITKTTGGQIQSKVITAAIDTNTGDIYYGISGMNNNPTRNAINPQMQAILDSVDGSMTNYPLENCGEFNAINNALNNGADINALRVYSIKRVGGGYKEPCINCQNLYGNIVHFTE